MSTEPIKPSDVVCWTCGKKGHRSTKCPKKAVTISEPAVSDVFLTTIMNFAPGNEDDYHDDTF